MILFVIIYEVLFYSIEASSAIPIGMFPLGLVFFWISWCSFVSSITVGF